MAWETLKRVRSGSYAADRYIKDSKKLTEGVSGYVPFSGPLSGVLDQLVDGLKNGLIYAGAQNIAESYKMKIERVTVAGQT